MFGPGPHEGFKQTEQAARDEYARMQSDAARRAQVAQLGTRRTTLRKTIRHWFRSFMGREPVEP